MTEEALKEVGSLYVKKIQAAFDDKRLNDTGGGRASMGFEVSGSKLIITGLARVLFLEYGRRGTDANPSAKPPPFAVIRDWVERKLNVPDEEKDGISWAIVKKIAKEGTDILTDRTKGLQLEIILAELNDELSKIILNFEAQRITDGLFKTWIAQTKG